MTTDVDGEAPGNDNTPDAQPDHAALLHSADRLAEARDIRRDVLKLERDLARARSVGRVWGAAWIVAGLAFLAGVGWTVWNWRAPSRFVGPDIFCGVLIGLCIGGAFADSRWRSPEQSLVDLEDEIEVRREAARIMSALRQPPLHERRSLYREDVAGVIEQHRADSRKYRRVHNTLQNLIMIGSAATTTIAALDTRNQFTWQNITLVAIGFTITLAAAFTGYYKYRERSYFLLHTADAIEEEANAFALGVGLYRDFGPDQEQEALKLFTQRVEDHRNEQRRRQQQLDQPADQATPSSQPPAA
ncbi:DUF4231 domain-containing protein [Streptomyces sp. NPDC046909]|uniref:DUF4231 domain-containing protein n=1 Tax=Streptomyces sp. NPDC046909 TaxID=3155617 RepID=UPI0033D65278